MPLPITDTRPFFRPLCLDIVDLLRSLSADDWLRPTEAGKWRVREVVAHLLDTALRRLSSDRDRVTDSSAPAVLTGADLVRLVNELNATWIHATRRLSPRVLTDLYALASAQLAEFKETPDLNDVAPIPVSWAGHTKSPHWLDIGREFTEVWHHGSQIREAVGAGPFRDARWLRAVLQIAMHALPHAYRDSPGVSGMAVTVEITGDAGGTWTLQADDRGGWGIEVGRAAHPDMTARMTDETAWRLLFNALSSTDARSLVQVNGDATLAAPLFRARAVIV